MEYNETAYWLFNYFKKAHDAVVKYHYVAVYLTKEAVERYGDLKRGEKVIHTVKYANDSVL